MPSRVRIPGIRRANQAQEEVRKNGGYSQCHLVYVNHVYGMGFHSLYPWNYLREIDKKADVAEW